ncbi:MAG: DUF4834 family protein [Alistipes sp.]|nr:DUF4834 family protein [Alistipes sp.]
MNNFPGISDLIFALIRKYAFILIVLILVIIFGDLFFKIFASIFLLGILLIISVPIFIALKVRRMTRQMEEQFRQAAGGFNYRAQSQQSHSSQGEGNVKVHVGSAQQKKVSSDVGDYVEFEEVDSDKK